MQNLAFNRATTDDVFRMHMNNMPTSWNSAYHGDNLDIISRLMYDMVRKHNSVIVMRMDIYYNASPYKIIEDKNPFVSDFCEKVAEYGEPHTDINYFWTRGFLSHATLRGCQYHILFLINGDMVSDAMDVWRKASELWHAAFYENRRNGKIYLKKHGGADHQQGGIMLHKDFSPSNEHFNRCFHWVSYMAKLTDRDGYGLIFNSRGHSPISKRASEGF